MIPVLDSTSPRDWAMEHIFRLIQNSTSMTRSVLAASTGLPASTVSHAVARLLETGRIVEGVRSGRLPGSGSGRPPRVLRAATDAITGGAIAFGRGHVDVAIGDAHGTIVARSVIRLDHGREGEGAQLACERLQAMREASEVDTLAGIVAGVPSRVTPARPGDARPATGSLHLESRRRLVERFDGIPVELATRVSLAAEGEVHFGVGRRHRDFVVWRPSEPAEVGVVVQGQVCRGGTGLAGLLPRSACVGESIATVCNLFNPTAVVISHDNSEVLAAVIGVIRDAIDSLSPAAIAGSVEVLPGELGSKAEIRGALLRACGLSSSLTSAQSGPATGRGDTETGDRRTFPGVGMGREGRHGTLGG